MTSTTLLALPWLCALSVAVGVSALVACLLGDPSSSVVVLWERHLSRLDHALRFLRAAITAQTVGRIQIGTTLFALGLALGWGSTVVLLLIPLVWVGPEVVLVRKRSERIEEIETQLDTWLLVLANALKAVPALGDALASSAPLIGGPLAQELDIVMRERSLGSPLNVAMRAMARRVRSPVLAAAITTLEVASKTGGALSATLEEAAASLREMARLHGVVRTKTADSKMQAWVISFIPLVLLVVLWNASPELIEVLFENPRGHVVLAIAAVLWAGAIAGAIKILKVDL